MAKRKTNTGIDPKKAYLMLVSILFLVVFVIYFNETKSPQAQQLNSLDFQLENIDDDVRNYNSELGNVKEFLEEMEDNGLFENFEEINF